MDVCVDVSLCACVCKLTYANIFIPIYIYIETYMYLDMCIKCTHKHLTHSLEPTGGQAA